MDFKVQRNDITNMEVDAIVCPSNPKLKEGSGTSTAIFSKAGRTELTNACSSKITPKVGPIASSRGPLVGLKLPFQPKATIPVGSSVVTSAYALPSNIIIHTVVPYWQDGRHDEYEKLCEAYLSALVLADRTSSQSLAIPLLAAGNMGFDLDMAIEVAIKSIVTYQPVNTLSEVYLVTYGSVATQKMRDLGYIVEEVINEKYVQENDESYKPAVAHAAESAKTAAKGFVDQALRVADDVINDPEFQEHIHDAAVGLIISMASKAKDQLYGETIE